MSGGEPIVNRSALTVAIWFVVVGGVGVVNALAIYLVNWAVLLAVRQR